MRFFLLLLLLAAHAAQADPGPASRWHAQRRITADFSFDVQAVETGAGQFVVKGIRVRDRKLAQVIQEIGVDGADEIRDDAAELLSLADANQDGRLDLMVPMYFGGTGNIRMTGFYLFDSASGRFVLHPALSAMANVEIVDGTVQASFRSATAFGTETFRFRGNRLQKMASSEVVFSLDGAWETTTHCKRAGARMRCKTNRKRKPADPAH